MRSFENVTHNAQSFRTGNLARAAQRNVTSTGRSRPARSALALFVARIGANNVHPPFATDDLAVFTNPFHACADLHRTARQKWARMGKPTSISAGVGHGQVPNRKFSDFLEVWHGMGIHEFRELQRVSRGQITGKKTAASDLPLTPRHHCNTVKPVWAIPVDFPCLANFAGWTGFSGRFWSILDPGYAFFGPTRGIFHHSPTPMSRRALQFTLPWTAAALALALLLGWARFAVPPPQEGSTSTGQWEVLHSPGQLPDLRKWLIASEAAAAHENELGSDGNDGRPEVGNTLADLPANCLSGLAGISIHDLPPEQIRRDIEQVRELIQSGHFAPQFNPLPRPQPENEQTARSGDDPSMPLVEYASFNDYNPHARASNDGVDVASHIKANTQLPCDDPHADVFQETLFPSATQCATCHRQIYDEWATSSHAYAALSPMFQRFEDKINQLTQGTIGYFCMRCHAPVATTVGLRRDQPIWDGPRVFREGVTCVACHRVRENYTKVNGERRIEPGDIYDPVSSGSGQLGAQIVAKYKDYFKVKTSPLDTGPGQPMHGRAIEFEQLSQSDFCMSCHQVAVQPGIKLEVVWDQYRASPAYRDGTACQECHMGIVPGRAEGYSVGPAAVVDGKAVTPERKHSNHAFYGPGYSIAHPGVFPQNERADRWAFNDWLQFDWRGGWGTDEFEEAISDGRASASAFPPAWSEPDDRYDAREIIDANLNQLVVKRDLRRQVLENGSKIDGPFFQFSPAAGEPLRFHYCVTNTNPGHNMPSGSLGAQPQLWLNVALIGPDGCRIWESGYLDSEGDLADLHSRDVGERRVPLDKQLFNLQTKFLATNVKGTDREMYLPINFDIDQLPFIRPAPQPVSVLNHPPGIRMEAHSIPPLGSRKAKYVIPADLMGEPGTYRLSVRLRSRAEPIYFMRFVEATPEMIRMMNEWIVDAHVQSVVFEVR